MANEIYHRSNWGESKPEGFGDMYFDPSATNKLYNRSTYYENSDATDKILGDIPNKASIVLTPTGYSEDSINTTIPPYQVLPEELVTNGTFDTDTNWTKGSAWSISNGKAVYDDSAINSISQSLSFSANKKYQISFIVSDSSGSGGRFKFSNNADSVVYFDYAYYTDGSYSLIYSASSNSSEINIKGHTNGSSFKIDNLSVKEIQEADFTFARNSSATRVNQAGLIEDVNSGTNLVTNGTFDTDSDWTLGNNISISDGKLVFNNATSNTDFAQQGIVAPTGKNYKITFTVSDLNSGDSIKIRFPFQDTSVNTNGTHTIFGVGTDANFIRITPNSSTGTFSIDDLSVIQLDEATDIPRLDYTTGQGAFLLEPQSTNLITYSEDFSQWINDGNQTSASTITDTNPDGTSTVYQIDLNTGGNLYKTITVSSSTDYTLSIYIKGSGSGKLVLSNAQSSPENSLDFTATNEWQRIKLTGSSANTSIRVAIGSWSNSSANGTIQIYGAQLEQSSFVTSYIPTVGSTVTRSAESANSSGNSDLFNDSEGVLYAEIASLAEAVGNKQFSISNGSNSDHIKFSFSTTENQIQMRVKNSGTTTVIITTTLSPSVTDFFKVALKYKADDCALFVNGVKTNTDTSATMPSGLNTFNFDRGDGGNDYIGKVKNIQVYNTALTDAELIELTS